MPPSPPGAIVLVWNRRIAAPGGGHFLCLLHSIIAVLGARGRRRSSGRGREPCKWGKR